MPQPRVLVLRAPGTNCDVESAYAFELAGARAERLHIYRLLESARLLEQYQILCLPGGFSFGDDLGAGRILGAKMRSHLAHALAEFKAAGKLILGICNGFQILVKSGVLIEDDSLSGLPTVTLTWNDSGRYQDRWVRLRRASDKCVFFNGIESLYLPIAHAEGKFVPRDPRVLAHLESAGQLALRYDGNPNGAIADVAGVCDSTGRVCGLMPHPERFIDPTQHPRWTRGEAGEVGDGLKIFQNAVAFWN